MNWTTAQLNLAKCRALRWLQRRGVTAGCPEPSRSSPTAKPTCWKLKTRSMRKSGCSASMWLWPRPKSVRTARPLHTCDAFSVRLIKSDGCVLFPHFSLWQFINIRDKSPVSNATFNLCSHPPHKFFQWQVTKTISWSFVRWAWQRAHCGQKGSLRRTLMNHAMINGTSYRLLRHVLGKSTRPQVNIKCVIWDIAKEKSDVQWGWVTLSCTCCTLRTDGRSVGHIFTFSEQQSWFNSSLSSREV